MRGVLPALFLAVLLGTAVHADTIPTDISIQFVSTVHLDPDSVTPSETNFNWTFAQAQIFYDGRIICGSSPDTFPCRIFFTTSASFTSLGRFEHGGSTITSSGPSVDFLLPALVDAITFNGTPQPNCFVDMDDPICNPNTYLTYDVTLNVNNFEQSHQVFSGSEKFVRRSPCGNIIVCADGVVPGVGPLFPESETPEPSSLLLLGTGIIGLIATKFRLA